MICLEFCLITIYLYTESTDRTTHTIFFFSVCNKKTKPRQGTISFFPILLYSIFTLTFKSRLKIIYIIPGMPPISGIAGADELSGRSATTASVVRNSEATDAAF